jgi:hypothetical protein
MSRVDDEVRTLLGSESVAAEKDKSGRRLDMIGWLIDLDAQLVTIRTSARRCMPSSAST